MCFLRNVLFVSCVCLAFARSNLDENRLDRNDKDKENQWNEIANGFPKDGRHLNDDTRDETENSHTSSEETERLDGTRVGSSRHDDDSHGRSEDHHRDHPSEHNDGNHRSGHRDEENDREKRGEEHEKGFKAKGTRSKDCGGARDQKKGKEPRHLRAHKDRESAPECKDEEDDFGLPVILGISGGALIAIFALAAIVVWCYRRRISSKSAPAAVGMVVVGQPVTDSVPKEETNGNENSLHEVSK